MPGNLTNSKLWVFIVETTDGFGRVVENLGVGSLHNSELVHLLHNEIIEQMNYLAMSQALLGGLRVPWPDENTGFHDFELTNAADSADLPYRQLKSRESTVPHEIVTINFGTP